MTNTDTHPLRPLSDLQLKTLMGDLNAARVESRRQGGASLSYLAAWDVKATLIRVFGFGGFSAEADLCEEVRIENNIPKYKGYGKDKEELPIEYNPDGQIKYGTANFRVTMRVRVKLTIHQLGAVYTEWAASSQTGPDLGEVTDFAIKTAESDGLKRAAIYLGTQFGLSLYDSGSTTEVVRAIVAPGQAWRHGARWDPEEIKRLQAAANGERPASAGESVAHLRPEGVSDEEHQQRMENLNNALGVQVQKQKERQAAEGDVPMALDTSLERRAVAPGNSGEPMNMDPDYGGDGGKAEGMAYEQL